MNKWHKVIEGLEKQLNISKNPKLYEEMKSKLENLPVFIFDKNMEIIAQEHFIDSYNSFKSMIRMNGLVLPFEHFVIQKPEGNGRFSFFDIELSKTHPLTLITSFLILSENEDILEIAAFDLGIIFEFNNDELTVSFDNESMVNPKITKLELGQLIYQHVTHLLVQLSTKGMITDRQLAPEKLNKKRIKNGKSPISDTIYIRSSHYYDSSGKEHKIDEHNPVKIHWRRGHIRGVRHGIGRAEIKQVYIQPCLVNFKSEAEIPEFKTYKVSA